MLDITVTGIPYEPTVEEKVDVSSDTIIDFTQVERLKLLKSETLTEKMQLAVLDSLSFVALNNKKIKSEDNTAATNREMAVALARLTHTTNMRDTRPLDQILPAFQPVVPDVEVVFDELSTSLAQIEFSDLVKNKGQFY